ncbi:cytochrome P450 [Cryphonectria parasitica EP155]|uniref:Cytochrome P450 n=1 Tax=Cryphonectria parasitica (strain ATCC 38755 / EP155) TaxID=660469 RepID=A0A9P4XVK8_CRYP1|nr:cytochrome P450 [Cryphonectria parasitica EP155]KAF3761575.1 cytochrome P450 [Cryphonectria parasitica EP155]
MASLSTISTGWLPSASAVLILLVGLVLSSILRKSGIQRDGQYLKKPPNTLPLVGNGLLFLQAREKLFGWFVRCERLFGRETFELYVPSLPPGVVINDPKNLEFVFKNEGVFAKGEFMKKPLWDLFGHGIINSDGELWRVQRKAGLSFLNNKNLQVLTDVALPRYLAQSISHLKASCSGGGRREADLQAVFHEITSQLMGKMAYNMEMHADDEFSVAFDYASGVCAERVQNPLWQVTEVFFGSRMKKSVAIVGAFGKRIVDSAIEDRKRGLVGGVPAEAPGAAASGNEKLDEISGSLIQSLLDSIGDQRMVADAALNYLSAGRDTTAQALTWTFHLLMHHRYAYAKIRSEVQSLLDDDSSSSSSPSPPHSDAGLPFNPNLFTPSALPYTHAVLLESLRLRPPIPFEIKQAQSATTLPDGTFLPAGSVVVWCPWAMNRSRLTWGDDATAFRPERWLQQQNHSAAAGGGPAPEFPVFNGGPRTCLGKRMAELVAVQVIAAVVWSFDFVPAYEGTERRSKSSLTLPMDGGLPVFVKVRSRGGGLTEGRSLG